MKDKSFHIPVGQFSDRAQAASRKAMGGDNSVQMQGESKVLAGANNVTKENVGNGRVKTMPNQTVKAPLTVKAKKV